MFGHGVPAVELESPCHKPNGLPFNIVNLANGESTRYSMRLLIVAASGLIGAKSTCCTVGVGSLASKHD